MGPTPNVVARAKGSGGDGGKRTGPTLLGVKAFQRCQGVWHYSWAFRVVVFFSNLLLEEEHLDLIDSI